MVRAFFPLICLGLVLADSAAGASDIAVVAHPSVPIDSLSFAEIRKILLGDRQFWASNLKVTLLIRAPAAREREVILKNVYQMSEAQFRQYWIGKVFRAESASAPRVVYSGEEAIQLATSIPGALTFLDAGSIPKSLKVIKIEGLSPGQAGYRLR